jgi:predicted transport protein
MDEKVSTENAPAPKNIKFVDIVIKDENTALNVMVNFLELAQKRGAFGIDESAKIWECVKMFHKPV